ncbi:hypothetical protein JGI17_11754 [Candidatus Kryptonium thompsonii]|nr:hypothetical protein JGI17_11754 [Candidatus Kryptonium thompsoni]
MVRFLRVALLLFFVSFTLLGQGEKIYNPVADSLFKSGLDFFKLGLNARIVQADTAGFRYFLNAYSNFDSVISLDLNSCYAHQLLLLHHLKLTRSNFAPWEAKPRFSP